MLPPEEVDDALDALSESIGPVVEHELADPRDDVEVEIEDTHAGVLFAC